MCTQGDANLTAVLFPENCSDKSFVLFVYIQDNAELATVRFDYSGLHCSAGTSHNINNVSNNNSR